MAVGKAKQKSGFSGGQLRLNGKPKPTVHGAGSNKHCGRDHDRGYSSNHGANALHARRNQGDTSHGDMPPHVMEPTQVLIPGRQSETEVYASTVLQL